MALDQMLAGQPEELNLAVERDGERFTTTLQPTYIEMDEVRYDLGLEFYSMKKKLPGTDPFSALGRGAMMTGNTLVLIVRSFGYLFTIKADHVSDVVAGPIRITQMMGSEALTGFAQGIGEGFSKFFDFLCIISILLGFMNLLPIPMLDGGAIVLSVIMNIKKDLGVKFITRYQLVGLTIVVLLTILALYSDLSSFFINS